MEPSKESENEKPKKNKKTKELAVHTEPIAEEATPDSSSSNGERDEEVEESAQCTKSVSPIITETNEKKDQAVEEEEKEIKTEDRSPSPDSQKMLELSRLPEAALAAYIQELDAEVYELGQREARELTRSKHLRLFGNNRRRANKRE